MPRSLTTQGSGSRRRGRKGSARLRLALLFSGMFLLLGTVAVMIIFLLTSSSLTIHSSVSRAAPVHVAPGRPPAIVVLPSRGAQIQQRNADRGQLLEISWLVLAVTALGSTVLGWLVAGRVLRPLGRMAATAGTISAGNLHERLALDGPDDEFKRLGDAFDDLLARLEASFDAQRRFVANASHELRTPLTLERALLQVALADPEASAGTLRATCEELLAGTRDQERLLEALLTLASTERGLDRLEALDLAALADRAVADAGPAAERLGCRVQATLDPAPVRGDPALLQRMIANLVDNALRYNDARGQVHIVTTTEPYIARLAVANTGAPVAGGEIERLLEPFQRLGKDRTGAFDGHHGLGLSIVQAIATAHGGTVLVEPLPAGGLQVTVTLPRASRRAA